MNIGMLYGSNDLYGASNVLLHDAAALIDMGHAVAVQLPSPGPLDPLLRSLGCTVSAQIFPSFGVRTPATCSVVDLGELSVVADAD